jgi:hypothetical protein
MELSEKELRLEEGKEESGAGVAEGSGCTWEEISPRVTGDSLLDAHVKKVSS